MGPWTLSSWHWNAMASVQLSSKPCIAVGFPSFPVAIGPMNLVPSVKPGARELNASEMTERFFFFPKVAMYPKSHHLSGFLGFTRNSRRDWGSGARWQTGPLWNICPGATWQQIFCTEPGVAAILAGLHFGEHGPRMFKEVSSWKVPVELNHCRFQLVAAMHSRCSWHQEHGRLGKFPIGRPWP